MRMDTAVSLIVTVADALAHRQICLEPGDRDLPEELLVSAFERLEREGIDTSPTRKMLSRFGVTVPPSSGSEYVRRANNQVPAEVETLIVELLDRGWAKTAIAKHLKINRRVVIRVSREAQNAQFADTNKHGHKLTLGR